MEVVMLPPLTPTSALDYGNAFYLATAASLAYDDDDEEAFQRDLGLVARLFPGKATDSQAFVGSGDADIVVAFRGSESPLTAGGRKDWLLTNARQQLVLPP